MSISSGLAGVGALAFPLVLVAAVILWGMWSSRDPKRRRPNPPAPAVEAVYVQPQRDASKAEPKEGRVTRPTMRLLASLFVVLAAALVLGNIPILAVGAFAFLVAVGGLLAHVPTEPEVRRTVGKSNPWVSEVVTVTWNVTMRGGIGPVILFDRLPKEIELVGGTNVRAFWKRPGEIRLVHSYSLRCPKRGTYDLDPTRWEARHPLEFRQPGRGTSGTSLRINVLPRVLALRRLLDVRGLAVTPYPTADIARSGVATTDFKELREYLPGDPIRNINWKATARQAYDGIARPLVNQFEFEGKKAIWLFVDSSQHMGVGTNIASPLEHAIEAASTLGHFYLTRGYYLGAHFSVRPSGLLYADTGRRQLQRLTQELLTLQPAGAAYDLLGAIHACGPQLVSFMPRCVIFTRLDREPAMARRETGPSALATAVRRLRSFSSGRQSRISVWIIAINGYAYAPAPPASGDLAATLRELETRPLVRELRRSGAAILEWDPFHEPFARVLVRQLRLERGKT